MSLWHKDYFELEANKTTKPSRFRESSLPPPHCLNLHWKVGLYQKESYYQRYFLPKKLICISLFYKRLLSPSCEWPSFPFYSQTPTLFLNSECYRNLNYLVVLWCHIFMGLLSVWNLFFSCQSVLYLIIRQAKETRREEVKNFPPLQSSLRHKIPCYVTGSFVISAFSILLENENNCTAPSIMGLLRKTRRPFIWGNYQYYCQIVIFIWSPSRHVSLHFLVLGRKNFSLLLKILLAALRTKLTWAKLTGENQINYIHARNPYKHERFQKQAELCTYAILSKGEGCRVLGLQRKRRKFTGRWKK